MCFSRPSGVAGNFAVDADTYLSAIQKGFHDIDTSTRAIAKALGVSPQAYSYARIAYMPDVANSGLLQWPGINPESDIPPQAAQTPLAATSPSSAAFRKTRRGPTAE